ncbi:MAG: membrane protein insertase YidC [Chlamydiales bacterium]|nr:membrane protein insertase YidC [Chlamydiales bacterium]
MDKRTIIFVLLVGVTFFGLNFFFSYQRDEKNREFLKQQEAAKARREAQIRADTEVRTAKFEDLPLVQLHIAPERESAVAYGIDVNGTTLTLAWDKTLPDIVYVGEQAQILRTKDVVRGGPVIYAPEEFENLDMTTLPGIGVFEVQLVTFPARTSPNIFLGELKEGELTIPAGPIDQNAIALHKTDHVWLPAGFYEWRSGAFIDLQTLPNLTDMLEPLKPIPVVEEIEKEEKYYLLENAYQQLVFSNVGGALVEINLPFESEENPHSVVKEIGFDRDIANDHPANARFPAHPYYTPDSKDVHPPGEIGGYYPLLRRGIWNKKTVQIAPQYYAINLVSDYPEMAGLIYEVKEFTPEKIVFEATQAHRKITKTYTLKPKASGPPYILDLSVRIDGDSRGLWLTSGIPEVEIMSNSSSPQILYRLSRKGKGDVEKLSLPKVKEVVTVGTVNPEWVVNSNGYLGVIMDPLTDIAPGFRATAVAGNIVPTRLSVLDPEYNPYPAAKYPGYETLLPIPTRGGTLDFRIYAGPFEESVLKAVDSYFTDPDTGENPEYVSSRSFYGWFSFISEPFAKLLFVVMSFFHTLTHSWGLSIILLTIFLRVLLYPLNAWSIKSMRRMQLLSPQIQAIQKKYKKEPKKAQIEIMALYKEKKVNPFTGCIPILIQIPFLIAMFDLLKSSFQLRGAVFIPGWIDNLTAPDVLFQWKTPIFFIGNQFHLLPILLGVVMFFQQRLTSTSPKDPKEMTDQQRQQKTMGTIMTVVFMVMFYHFPSGLNLYWLSSMLLGIVQTLVTNRMLDKKFKQPELLVPKKKKKHAK